MHSPMPVEPTRDGSPTDTGDSVVTLDQVPRWSDAEQRLSLEPDSEDSGFSSHHFPDPLASASTLESGSNGIVSRFPVDHEINSRLYLWRGHPWNMEVDAVVNSTSENLDEAHSSPGLHAAAGSGLAEECAALGGCRTGMAKMTSGYDLPARKVIHTVGPKYAVKYHTAAENALSHCYRSCLELLIENGLQSIAMGCIYSDSKNYPREPAAHVAIRTVRRFLEKQKDSITAIVFCTSTTMDTEIYKRLLPLYFPRDKHEEEVAMSKLPADVGDENGATTIDERKIRIHSLPNLRKIAPKPSHASDALPLSDVGLVRRNSGYLDAYLDPSFMSLLKDPDQRRKEQWEKAAEAQRGFKFSKMLGLGNIGSPLLSAAEEYTLHSRYLTKANSSNLAEIAEMKIVYRGGVDSEGHPVMVVVGAHFLLRCLDLERFIQYVVKEFEPIIQKPYSIVYFHSAASLQPQPDLGWMKRLQQILGRKHQRNLHAIYVLHPTFGLKAAIFALQTFVDNVVWKKVVYADRLLQLFRYVPREQLTIPDFVFQHDLEVNGGKGLIVDPRTKWYFLNESHYETIMFYNCLRKCLRECDDVVFSNVLKACCVLRYVNKGREVHCYMVKFGSLDSFVLTSLVDVYAKCGMIDAARGVFNEIEDRNVVSWTSLIAGYVQNDCAKEGLILFNRMRDSLVDGNQFTVGSLVTGCAKLGALHQGKWLHGYIIKAGINVNSFLATSLLDMYVKCRSIIDARSVYDELSTKHDVVCWTAMIVGLSQCGQPNEALKLFVEGKYSGIVPNSMTIASVLSACAQVGDVKMGRLVHCFATVNGLDDSEVKHALIDMYAKCHLVVESRYIFDLILDKDVIAWNSVISGYTQNGYSVEALKLFHQMTLESMSPDAVTLVSAATACASLSAITVGSSLHTVIIKKGLSRNNAHVGCALLNLYAKCGYAISARKVFDEIGVKNAVTWSSMIRSCGMHGDEEESFALFNDMLKENVEPNEVTFTAILSACSHTGRVGEGWNYFVSMCREYSFVPSIKHYACMVDTLSRAGKLEEALDFIQKMPIEPDFSVLGAFLHGCSLHSRFELGEVVAKRMLEIHPNEACYYVLLCKFYASDGRWDKADEMRSLMKERGLSKSPGWSSGSEMDSCDQLPLLQMSSVG
ncbi:hypothetical protein KSS87_017681 [Heliosperma pusillum]|nr:hypothetical protein KSS87_017681 [Heliosperma pusillum]